MLTQEIVHELLDYDPETGKLFWKERSRRWFSSNREYNRWNTRYSGKEAFVYLNKKGYFHGKLLGKSYKLHQVIWIYMTGKWPENEIDHINHIKNDNRWYNLRLVSHQENCKNCSRSKRNTSGHVGVHRNKEKWRARIMYNGKYIYLGDFNSYDEAIAVRKESELKYKFHQNHGMEK